MGDSFQCAKCGAKYTRERRRVGRAVVCSCGHKFLVPPADEGPQPSYAPPRAGTRPAAAKADVRSDDSSGEVLPLAEVVETGAPPGRWAEPVAADETVPEAEIVYATPVEPAPPGASFPTRGAHGGSTSAPGGPTQPRRAGARLQPGARQRPPSRHVDQGPSHDEQGPKIAYIVLCTALPVFVLLSVLAVLIYKRIDRTAPGDPSQNEARSDGTQDTPSTTPDAPGGLPILVVRVTKQPASDDFTMQYDVRHGALNASSQYVWVVSAAQGKIEFQIPTPAPGRGQISGKPAQPSGLSPPFTAYIEEQSADGRTRVSNEVEVSIAG